MKLRNLLVALIAVSFGLTVLGALLCRCEENPAVETLTHKNERLYAEGEIHASLSAALTAQANSGSTWEVALGDVIAFRPGGGHQLSIIDGVLVYESDSEAPNVCLGGWIGDSGKITIAECDAIVYPRFSED